MKRLITLIVLAALPAHAKTCLIAHSEHLINGGKEKGGVPNYAQKDFAGKNDCGPTAAAMILGYYDANGWPCMVPGEPYYTDWSPASEPLKDMVADLADALPYWEGWGTPAALGFNFVGEGVAQVANQQDSGANWAVDEDEIVSKGDIKSHINADRPVMLMARAAHAGTFSAPLYGNDVSASWHWMPILGYEEKIEGDDFFGGCADWLDYDEFYLALRTGWQRGSDHTMWYHWSAWDDLYTVELWPNGSPECTDPLDADGDGHGTDAPPLGMSAEADCDDSKATVYPGAPELCNGVDDNCDGSSDEGLGDIDGDGWGDACDWDMDGDGHANAADNCPQAHNPSQADADGDGLGNSCDDCIMDPGNDLDSDGHCAASDNCPSVANPGQEDHEADGTGDACDPDDDDDGVDDTSDNCPWHANAEQSDVDEDGAGDACDNDDDNDGLLDEADNCPGAYNPCQEDYNGDGMGDACQCVGEPLHVALMMYWGYCPVFNAEESIADYYGACGLLELDPVGAEVSVERISLGRHEAMTQYPPRIFERRPRVDPMTPPDGLWDPPKR